VADLFPITIDDMIEEAERELAMRPRVYGRRVAEGKMKRKRADWQITVQRAIVEKLRRDRAALDG
jgi:hypothetical protein